MWQKGLFASDHPNRCAFLDKDMLCARYDNIRLIEEGSAYPMFGSGCCSPLFNERREKKLNEDTGRDQEGSGKVQDCRTSDNSGTA